MWSTHSRAQPLVEVGGLNLKPAWPPQEDLIQGQSKVNYQTDKPPKDNDIKTENTLKI